MPLEGVVVAKGRKKKVNQEEGNRRVTVRTEVVCCCVAWLLLGNWLRRIQTVDSRCLAQLVKDKKSPVALVGCGRMGVERWEMAAAATSRPLSWVRQCIDMTKYSRRVRAVTSH